MPRPATIEELEEWEATGAHWRTVELSDHRAVIDLCSCTGEAMERLESDQPDLISFVRRHRSD